MTRLITYLRRSTDQQTDSIETQETMVADWCARNGHDLVRSYREIPISGGKKIERRPMLSQLLADVAGKRRDFDGLVVWKLDRLAREPGTEYLVLGILDQHKCAIHSATEQVDRKTASGRLMYHQMMGFRAYERELTGERIYAHNLSQMLHGRWPGGCAPLGFTYDPGTKAVTINDRAADVIAVFREFTGAGGNASQTARSLNILGLVSRNGNPWRDDSVLTIVKSPIYRQRLRYDGREADAPDLIPALIPADLLAQVDIILEQLRPFKTRQRARKFLYSGLLTCSECGSRMKHNGGNGWTCAAKKDSGLCVSRNVSNNYVDRLVGDAVQKALSEYARLISREVPICLHPKKTNNNALKRSHLEDMKSRVWEAYISRQFSADERDRRIAAVDSQLAALQEEKPQADFLNVELIESWICSIDQSWARISDEDRRKLLDAISARIIICTARHTRLWADFNCALQAQAVHVSLKDRNR